LQDALGNLNKEKAFRIAKYFGDNQKANPMVLTLSMLYLYFQKLMLYHYATDKSEKGLASAIGVNPFLLKNYHKAARNFPPGRIEKIFTYLKECDLKLKGIGNRTTNAGELLKELTYKILH
jgi:DNA polymerase-3 subunit delta